MRGRASRRERERNRLKERVCERKKESETDIEREREREREGAREREREMGPAPADVLEHACELVVRLQGAPDQVQIHLTECVNSLVLESHLPHKIVNLSFTIAYQNIKLTVLWGSRLSKTDP